MNQGLIEEIFSIWMQEKHPWYGIAVLIAITLFIIGLIASVVTAFFFDWWWKLLLATIVFAIIGKLVNMVVTNYYVEEFKSGKNKL